MTTAKIIYYVNYSHTILLYSQGHEIKESLRVQKSTWDQLQHVEEQQVDLSARGPAVSEEDVSDSESDVSSIGSEEFHNEGLEHQEVF